MTAALYRPKATTPVEMRKTVEAARLILEEAARDLIQAQAELTMTDAEIFDQAAASGLPPVFREDRLKHRLETLAASVGSAWLQLSFVPAPSGVVPRQAPAIAPTLDRGRA